MKREVPLLLTFLFGAFFILSDFIVWPPWKTAAENVNNWVLIVIAFTYVLGVGNVLRIHGLRIARREAGWGYSAATLAGLSVMMLFGLALWFLPTTEGGTTLRFRALKGLDAENALHISPPAGTGDLFDLRVETRVPKDPEADRHARPGDEVDCRIRYAYSGAAPVDPALFTIGFDAAALEPLDGAAGAAATGGGREPGPPPEESPVGAPPGKPMPPSPPPAGSASPSDGGLVWNAGRIDPSLFGTLGAGTGQSSVYTWFYDAIYVPMQSTMFALLAFFISSAAFRAFRVRSTHAVLLGVTALVVILGSVPVGEAVWGQFPTFVAWVMNCLQTAGKRAILIGAALGAIATGFKMIIGAEKGYLSRD